MLTYSSKMYGKLGLAPVATASATLGMGVLAMLATFGAVVVIDRFGRRTLMLASMTTILLLSTVLMALGMVYDVQ